MTRLALGLALLAFAAPAAAQTTGSATEQARAAEEQRAALIASNPFAKDLNPTAFTAGTLATPAGQAEDGAAAASPAPAIAALTTPIGEAVTAPLKALGSVSRAAAGSGRAELDAMIARHAQAHGVPLDLAHRVVIRESRYNPRAVSKGNYGLMQIRLGTARGLGYRGDATGLLDPETNLTYAMKYLAGAYKVAGGNHGRAVSYYASGYYYAAKSQRVTREASAAE